MLFEFFAVVGALFSAAFVAMAVIIFCYRPSPPGRPRHRHSPSVGSTLVAMALNNPPYEITRQQAPIDTPAMTVCSSACTDAAPIPVYPVEHSTSRAAECQQLAIEALDVAATFAVGDMHAARAIVEAALATPQDASLDLYVVAEPCAGMPSAVVTLASLRTRWPRLFEHGDPGSVEGTKVWSLLLLPEPARLGRIVVHRVAIDRAMLDVEFGPREDPIVARLRALIPAPPPM